MEDSEALRCSGVPFWQISLLVASALWKFSSFVGLFFFNPYFRSSNLSQCYLTISWPLFLFWFFMVLHYHTVLAYISMGRMIQLPPGYFHLVDGISYAFVRSESLVDGNSEILGLLPLDGLRSQSPVVVVSVLGCLSWTSCAWSSTYRAGYPSSGGCWGRCLCTPFFLTYLANILPFMLVNGLLVAVGLTFKFAPIRIWNPVGRSLSRWFELSFLVGLQYADISSVAPSP